jgi:hypothetical protein
VTWACGSGVGKTKLVDSGELPSTVTVEMTDTVTTTPAVDIVTEVVIDFVTVEVVVVFTGNGQQSGLSPTHPTIGM